MKTPPALPWKSGTTSEFQTASILLQVCQDTEGNGLWSHHDPLSDEDREIMLGWGTGGLRQVRDSLLIEGVRRASILRLLAQLSTEKDYLERIGGLDQEGMSKELDSLCKLVQGDVSKVLSRVLEASVREAIAGVLETLPQ